MCLGVWSKLEFVMDSDIKATVIVLPELCAEEDEDDLNITWDRIF